MKKTWEKVDILLPVYNGEKFLSQQIESILAQTQDSWRLLIRDDGSKDNSLKIIEDYCSRNPDKIIRIQDEKGNLGIMNNTFELLKYVEAGYVMLSDQDDVWFPSKIDKLLSLIQKKERNHPKLPILVHSEAIVTDEKLKPLEGTEIDVFALAAVERELWRNYRSSYFAVQNQCDKTRVSFVNLLFLNVVQGASMIFNQALYERLKILMNKKINKNLYHDSVIASIASICGKIFFYGKPLMLYRQHNSNLVGAKIISLLNWMNLNEKEKNRFRSNHYLNINQPKCELILKYYKGNLSIKQIETIEFLCKRRLINVKFIKLGLCREFSAKDLIGMAIFGIK
ncbi:MAG: glycosyltransferase family 2 protein [Mobilitalea sp.]